MLYQIYETQRALLSPFADFAQAYAKLYSNPLLPFSETVLSQRMSAGFDLLHRLGKGYDKPEFDIDSVKIQGIDVTVRERVAMEYPFCQLRRFKRFTDDAQTLDNLLKQPTVLVVAPLSGHYSTLLRETVRSLLSDHKVYITDWTNARLVPMSEGEFHLDDYVNYVQEFIRFVQEEHGQCHVISVCQPTVPVMAAVSLMASRGEMTPLSMTMMGGPIDARRSPTAVNNLAMQRSYEWFENNVIYRVPHGYPGEGRRVYPGFLQYTGFVAMNPDRHATSYYDYFKNLVKGDDASAEQHRKFYDEYNAVLDMDANYYLETIRTVFQEFSLVNGTWYIKSPQGHSELVRPQDITTTALLTVEGELDDISGSGQTRAAHDLCSHIPEDKKLHLDIAGAGHYGIFSGSKWRTIVYPRLCAFIQAHHSDAFVDHESPATLAEEISEDHRSVRKNAPHLPASPAADAVAPEKSPAAEAPVQVKPSAEPIVVHGAQDDENLPPTNATVAPAVQAAASLSATPSARTSPPKRRGTRR